jgi:fused signal recognition particle receptor
MFGLFKKKTEEGVKRSKEAWFSKITRLFDRARVDDSVWEELEELLISADVGVDTSTNLIQRVKERVKAEKVSDGPKVRDVLKQEMVKMLSLDGASTRQIAASPEVILVAGVNGSGKTTSIAKLANSYKKEKKRVILAAADTFRAAAIEQLQKWGDRIGVEVIAHQPGGDPGAVVFDALEAARSRGIDVVIVDTAGRLHTKFNLMEELKKIKRVTSRVDQSAPHQVLLVMDATTGQNGLAQAKHFTEAIGITGIFLAKLDGTAKGGIVLSICDSLKIPILYIGTGEGVEDIAPFDAESFVEALCST